MKRELFETAEISRAVLSLSLPTLGGMGLVILYNMADLIFVGMTGDADQIAVITLLMPVSIIVMAIGGIFGIGGGSCISRQLGLRRGREAAQTCSFCVYATIFLGVLCSMAGLCLLPWILSALGAQGDIYEPAKGYGTIVIGGAAPASLTFALNQLIRAKGAAQESMNGMALGAVVNFVLDPIFILFLGLGARGSALAALTADICSALYFLKLIRRDEILSIRLRDFSLNRCVVGSVLAVGIPSALTNLLICCSNILFNRLAMSHGKEVTAAFGVASRVLMIPSMAAMGLAKGAQPLIGYNYAAKNWVRMREAIYVSCSAGTFICTAFAAVAYFRSGGLIQIFTNDPDVVWLGTVILNAMVIAIPTAAVEAVLLSTFQAMGKVGAILVLSVGKQVLLYMPMMLFANHFFGLAGLIALEPLKEYMTVILAAGLYFWLMRGKGKMS